MEPARGALPSSGRAGNGPMVITKPHQPVGAVGPPEVVWKAVSRLQAIPIRRASSVRAGSSSALAGSVEGWRWSIPALLTRMQQDRQTTRPPCIQPATPGGVGRKSRLVPLAPPDPSERSSSGTFVDMVGRCRQLPHGGAHMAQLHER